MTGDLITLTLTLTCQFFFCGIEHLSNSFQRLALETEGHFKTTPTRLSKFNPAVLANASFNIANPVSDDSLMTRVCVQRCF